MKTKVLLLGAALAMTTAIASAFRAEMLSAGHRHTAPRRKDLPVWLIIGKRRYRPEGPVL